MIEHIENPAAVATVTWLPAEKGGRRSGPPTGPVYAATTAFTTGDPIESEPGWPATDPRTMSILLERTGSAPQITESMRVGFIAPELATSFLRHGAEFVVLEGPKPVAHGVVTEVLEIG
ncbi:hypothetical protein [Prauserella cavernicola]|uniref:Uncharacterized protein n=1 Tax=Prauserella cavernicola TaxID=2800127 RepID=A0A934V7M1_9PSEU|nr:hypothetical protein [Prauserella cavernicola]MBK1786883.1 hypothetical protein [Prauserella cavernicola]